MKLTKKQAQAEAAAIWGYLREQYASTLRAKLIPQLTPEVLAGVDILMESDEVATQAQGEIVAQLMQGKVPRGGYRTIKDETEAGSKSTAKPARTEPTVQTTMSVSEVLDAIRASFPLYVRELCAKAA